LRAVRRISEASSWLDGKEGTPRIIKVKAVGPLPQVAKP
jgi:hypothetical protein